MPKKRINKSRMRQIKKRLRRLKAQKRIDKLMKLRKEAQKNFSSYSEPVEEWSVMPDIFPEEVPTEQRKEIVAKIIDESKSEFNEIFPKLADWFEEFDSTYVLSFYAYYFMSQKHGTTNEHEGDFKHYQHYLEVLQAIALTKPQNINDKPLLGRAEELEDQMSHLGRLIGFKNFDLRKGDSDEETKRKRVIGQVRNHTAAIRNWAYYFQMEKATKELMSNVSQEFKDKLDVDPEGLANIFFGMADIVNDKFQAHRKKATSVYSERDKKSIFDTYEKEFPNVKRMTAEEREELFSKLGRSIKRLKIALVTHSDLGLQDIYSFSLDELSALYGRAIEKDVLKKTLDRISMEFGDLKDYELDHIILDNPALKKPFIKLDSELYFCPIVGSLAHFSIQILEDMIATDANLSRIYSKRKSSYCEDSVSSLLSKSFPSTRIYQNIKWERSDKPGQIFETDNLLLAGSFGLIVESKSGSVSPQAKRGADARLERHVKELIIEPSEQSQNFITAIKGGLITSVRDSTGKEIEIDFGLVKYFIPISVTFEHLGMLTNPRELVDATMNRGIPPQDLALSMTIFDLECVFEILKLESMKLHYLVRRREFAMHVAFLGDEMDLLGFYIESGFNIGNTEYGGSHHMNLVMHSRNIDKYFILVDDKPIPPPDNYLTKDWRTLLERLESKKPNGWIEAAFALLNCDKDSQKEYLRMADKFLNDMKTGKTDKYPKDPYMIFATGADKRKSAMVLYPYWNADKEDRNDTIAGILSDDEFNKFKIKIAIGIDLDRPVYPYNVIAVTKDSVLVEEPVDFIEY